MAHPKLSVLLARYGYWGVLVGAFFEGETIVLIGGYSAHGQYLDLPGVVACAFVGSLAGDQLAYQLGRRYGDPILARFPRFRPAVEEVRRRLEPRGTWLLVGFRFFYGLRNAVPFAAGVSGVRPRRFVPLNAIGAAVWAPVVTLLGYVFGEAFGRVARRYEEIGFVALVALGVFLYARRRLKERHRAPQG